MKVLKDVQYLPFRYILKPCLYQGINFKGVVKIDKNWQFQSRALTGHLIHLFEVSKLRFSPFTEQGVFNFVKNKIPADLLDFLDIDSNSRDILHHNHQERLPTINY